MPNFIFRLCFLRAALALVFLSGLPQSAFAVPGVNCGAADRLTVSLRLAQVLFPELKGKEFSVTLSSGSGDFVSGPIDTSDFSIRFDKPIWRPTVNGKPQPDTEQSPATLGGGVDLPFDLYFDFIRANVNARELVCHPLKFTSEVGHQQMEKVRREIDPHPEWSDEEELRVARKLGLRFGPEEKSAVLKKLPLNQLVKLYGPLRIHSASFSMNGGIKCTGCSFVYPRWDITLSGIGTPRWLLIVIEPFFGRVTSMSD